MAGLPWSTIVASKHGAWCAPPAHTADPPARCRVPTGPVTPPRQPKATQKPPPRHTHTAPAVPSLPSRVTMLGAVCVLLVLYPLEKRGCSRSRAGTQDCGACGTRARPRSGLRSWGGGCLRVRVGAAGHDEDMESLRLWRDSAEDKSSMVVAVSKDTLYESNVRHGAGMLQLRRLAWQQRLNLSDFRVQSDPPSSSFWYAGGAPKANADWHGCS